MGRIRPFYVRNKEGKPSKGNAYKKTPERAMIVDDSDNDSRKNENFVAVIRGSQGHRARDLC